MMVLARNRRMGERLKQGKLCSDRFFSARIMRKYLGKRNRFSGMPQMIFGEKASRFFSFKLNMLFAIPVQVMKQGTQNALATHGAIAATSSQLNYTRASANTVTREFNSVAAKQSVMFMHPSPASIQREDRQKRPRYGSETRAERIVTSSTQQFIRHAHGVFVDLVSRRQSILGEELRRRHELPVLALQSETAGIHATSGRSRKSLTEEGRELIFRSTDKIGREIDEVKRTLKKTEDQIQEKVARQLREIVTERNRQVDIGQITQQVYRNMERMIRIERERRGM